MDILAPKLEWIGGRCYRVNPTRGMPDDVEDKEPETTSSQYIEEGNCP